MEILDTICIMLILLFVILGYADGLTDKTTTVRKKRDWEEWVDENHEFGDALSNKTKELVRRTKIAQRENVIRGVEESGDVTMQRCYDEMKLEIWPAEETTTKVNSNKGDNDKL